MTPPTDNPFFTRNRPLLMTVLLALAAGLGVYALAEAGVGGAIGYTLVVVLPAALSAAIAWAGSARGTWTRASFFLVPVWICLAAAIIGAIFLGEGVVCILMATPFWICSGMLGVWPVYRYRQKTSRTDASVFRGNALLLLPLLALFIDHYHEPAAEQRRVTRDIIINAAPEKIWPGLLAITDIAATEGRWNISQNLIRLPRPVSASLNGQGVGAVRDARWQDDIRFQEIVTLWQPGRALHWRFAFPDPSIYRRTDRHINPHSRHLWIDRGGYELIPTQDGRTIVRLWTDYQLATPFNGYAALWGERVLGDIQTNVLGIVKDRVEAESLHAHT